MKHLTFVPTTEGERIILDELLRVVEIGCGIDGLPVAQFDRRSTEARRELEVSIELESGAPDSLPTILEFSDPQYYFFTDGERDGWGFYVDVRFEHRGTWLGHGERPDQLSYICTVEKRSGPEVTPVHLVRQLFGGAQ